VHHPSCERSEFCPTRPQWRRVNNAVATALGAVSLADMLPANSFLNQPAITPGKTTEIGL
jgi:DNA-binding IscR family transcriptional regulator